MIFHLTFQRGTTLGLVGESGLRQKQRLGRALLRLVEPTAGQVFYNETDITALNAKDLKAMRRKMQIIFSGSLRVAKSPYDNWLLHYGASAYSWPL